MGSVFEDFRPAEGEMTLNNALDMRLKFVRGWKRDGHPNPNPPAATIEMVAPGTVEMAPAAESAPEKVADVAITEPAEQRACC